MEEQKDINQKFVAWENLVKGVFTSALGMVLMIGAGYGYWNHHLNEWPAGVIGMIGFSLLWIRDQIGGFISQFVSSVLKKFFPGQ